MPLLNYNLDSILHGIHDADREMLGGLLDAAAAKLASLGLSQDASKAVTLDALRITRGPTKGTFRGSSNFNGRSVFNVIESIPAASKREPATHAAAREHLVAIHATLAAKCGVKIAPPVVAAPKTVTPAPAPASK